MACPLPLPPKWARYYHVWQMEWDSDFIEVRIDGETILKALDVKMGQLDLDTFDRKTLADL